MARTGHPVLQPPLRPQLLVEPGLRLPPLHVHPGLLLLLLLLGRLRQPPQMLLAVPQLRLGYYPIVTSQYSSTTL